PQNSQDQPVWWRDDSPVSAEVERVVANWRDGAAPSTVIAVGSTWQYGERVLAVGVDGRSDPRLHQWAPGRGPVDAALRAIVARVGPLPPPPPAPGVEVEGGLAVAIRP